MRLMCVLVVLCSTLVAAQSPYISQEQRERWHTTDAERTKLYRII